MNLFRSEEHVRRWSQFDPSSSDGIKPVATIAAVMSRPLFRERLAGDYIARLPERIPDFVGELDRMGGSPFWQMPASG